MIEETQNIQKRIICNKISNQGTVSENFVIY